MMRTSATSNIAARLDDVASRWPQRLAIAWPHRGSGGQISYTRVTFGELAAQVRRLAGALAGLGLRQRDRVVVLTPISPELYVIVLGLFRSGLTTVFLDPWRGRRHIDECCAAVAPAGFIGSPAAMALCQLSGQFRRIPTKILAGRLAIPGTHQLHQLLRSAPSDSPVASTDPDEVALITLTTGSTGRPKGVTRTHSILSAQQAAISAHFGYQPQDVDLPGFPLFVLNNLAEGIPSVIPLMNFRRPAHVDAEGVVREIQDHAVTTMAGPPATLRALVRYCEAKDLSLPTIRRVFTGGATVPRQLVDRLRRRVPHGEVELVYGSSEAEPIAGISGDVSLRESEAAQPGAGHCVGHPVPQIQLRILTPHDGPITLDGSWDTWTVQPGEIGEVTVAGAHVCRDYYNDPEAVRRYKIAGPDGLIWHRTGDAAHQDAAGRVWLVGRTADAVRQGGRTHYPLQVEPVIERLPFVERAAWVRCGPESTEERALLVIQPLPEAWRRRWTEQRRWDVQVRDAAARCGVAVSGVRFLQRLPMDARHNSRIHYAALRERFGVPLTTEARAWPFWRRFRLYLRERFPVLGNMLLIISYYSSNQFLAQALERSGRPLEYNLRSLLGGLALLLMFFHLRVFDEFKDYRRDVRLFPQRVLMRGIVSLADLRRLGLLALAAEAVISAFLGPAALVAYAAVLSYSLLMFKEFFIGEWLEHRQLVYAATHLLIMPLFNLFVFSVASGRWPWAAPWPFLIYAFVGFFVAWSYELARKVRSPEEERWGVMSYSKMLGPRAAAIAVVGVILMSTTICWVVGTALGFGWFFYGWLAALLIVTIAAIARFCLRMTPAAAKGLMTATAVYIIAFDLLVVIELVRQRGLTIY